MKRGRKKRRNDTYKLLMDKMEEIKLRASIRAINVKRDSLVKGGKIDARV